MSEIADAVQIIRLALDGVELSVRLGSASIATLQKMAKFLQGLLLYEKQMGRTNLKKLLMRGGDLQVLQFNKDDIKQVQKFAKKYGILYSVLPEMNKDSNKVEILFHSEAVPRINLLLQKLKKDTFKVRSMDKFLEEVDEKDLAVLDKYLKEQKKGKADVHADMNLDNLIEKVGQYVVDKKSVSMDELDNDLPIDKGVIERIMDKLGKLGVVEDIDNRGNYKVMMDRETFDDKIHRFRELNSRMQIIAASKNTHLSDITIAKKMLVEENDHAIKTRIPGTWGKDAKYIWIKKEDAMEIHDGKTILTFLDREKDYKIYSDDNRIVETVKGDLLYSRHYDPVNKAVREKYEQKFKKTAVIQPRKR